MPSVAQTELPSPLASGKKRGREEVGDLKMQMKLSSPHLSRYTPLHDVTTAHHNTVGGMDEEARECMARHVIPKPRRLHDYKKQRLEPPLPLSSSEVPSPRDVQPHSTLREEHSNVHHRVEHGPVPAAGEESAMSVKPRIDLSPCYICHRKPSARHELDAFADCEGCSKRTCWICIRECLGFGIAIGRGLRNGSPIAQRHDLDVFGFSSVEERMGEYADEGDGKMDDWDCDGGYGRVDVDGGAEASRWIKEHKGMVCSRCCVERGTEGEVWCLGCLKAESEYMIPVL